MSDEKFEKMDEKMMSAMKTLRENKVSDGMLKGFSTSVERRILAKKEQASRPGKAAVRAWAPVLAVMVLASLVVLRSPSLVHPLGPTAPQAVEYAQLSDNKVSDVEEEIAELKELGAWNEEDESILGASEEADAESLELSFRGGQNSIA